MEYRSVHLPWLLLSWLLFSALLLGIALPALAAPVEELPEESETEETSPILETVAENLEDIEAEPGVNAMGESMTESVDYYALASEAIERAYYESLAATYQTQEKTTLSAEEDFLQLAPLAQVNAAPVLNAANGSVTMPESKAYKLVLDGNEYYAWFPDGKELVVTDEGYFYNESSSSITALVSNSLDGVDINSYNDFVTVSPLLSSSSNNNSYRYGSRVYITHYYVTGNSLYSDVNYITDARCTKTPGAGYGFSKYQYVIFAGILIIVFMLLLSGRHRK